MNIIVTSGLTWTVLHATSDAWVMLITRYNREANVLSGYQFHISISASACFWFFFPTHYFLSAFASLNHTISNGSGWWLMGSTPMPPPMLLNWLSIFTIAASLTCAAKQKDCFHSNFSEWPQIKPASYIVASLLQFTLVGPGSQLLQTYVQNFYHLDPVAPNLTHPIYTVDIIPNYFIFPNPAHLFSISSFVTLFFSVHYCPLFLRFRIWEDPAGPLSPQGAGRRIHSAAAPSCALLHPITL